MNCETCKFWLSPDKENGMCKRYPAEVPKASGDFCGEWRDSEKLTPSAVRQKVTDRQLVEWFETLEEAYAGILWKDLMDKATLEFGMTSRQLTTRYEKLHREKRIEIFAPEEEPGMKMVRQVVDEKMNPIHHGWTNDLNGSSYDPSSRAKWSWDKHLLETFQLIAPSEDTAQSYNFIARQHPKMGRASFNRLLTDALKEGKIGKTVDGKYFLK